MRTEDTFRGCLIGGAVGDALGYAVEFMKDREIFREYGEKGITDYDLHNGVAEISDDTQMTLFTATGLLYATTRGRMRGIRGAYENYIRNHYRDWYRTQKERYPLKDEKRYSWLLNVPEMFHWRAPGNTCLAALSGSREGSVRSPINNSKGCGGVMRVAPVGLYFADSHLSMEESDRIGAEAAAITHGHELGWLPAAALSHVVRFVTEQENPSVPEALQDTMRMLPEIFPGAESMNGFLALLQKTMDLAGSDLEERRAIRRLGEGWVGDEALAVALYCVLKHPDSFEDAIVASVNHSGDSDSTGAIAGNIQGAALGMSAIPAKYTETLELRDVILELADDLYRDCPMTEYGDYRDPVWMAKYVDLVYPLNEA